MRVALITNHLNELRRSVRRFAELLAGDLAKLGVEVELLGPKRSGLSERLSPRAASVVDKLWFQTQLGRLRADVVHVIDQGDSGYATSTDRARTVITCHDLCVLDDPIFRGRPFTRGWAYRGLLIARMRRGLGRARALVCDSDFTLADAARLLPTVPSQLRERVYLPLRFSPPEGKPPELPEAVSRLGRPYLLHVGSNGHRKNRVALLDVVRRLERRFALVLAGDPPDSGFTSRARELGLEDQVVTVKGPSDAVLGRLYQEAHCLLFPSTFEGFGWPVLEAQACRCPVVTTDVTSLPEVAGNGALFASPSDTARLSSHVASLSDPERRRALLDLGTVNVERFRRVEIGREYLRIYEKVARGVG